MPKPGTFVLACVVFNNAVSGGIRFKENANNPFELCHVCLYPKLRSADGLACELCPAGKFNNPNATNGTSPCEQCPMGFARSVSHLRDVLRDVREGRRCGACEAGRYGWDVGASSDNVDQNCKKCPVGYHQPNAAATVCAQCPQGWFANYNKQKDCTSCPKGRWGNNNTIGPADSSCSDCPKGFASPERGRSSCHACPQGWFANSYQQKHCTSCPKGRWGNNNTIGPAGSSCSDCPKGFASPERGRSSCQACQPGRYAASNKKSKCNTCPPGTRQPNFAATLPGLCRVCPGGYFSNVTGAAFCAGKCPKGSFLPDTGDPDRHLNSRHCNLCPNNTFGPSPGAATCFGCPVPTTAGATSCAGCEPGRFGTTGNCVACSAGQFSDAVNEPSCKTCPRGQFAEGQQSSGARRCQQCSPGTYGADALVSSRVNESDACAPCPPGRYLNEVGSRDATFCKRCPPGRWNEHSGSPSEAACEACAPGKFGTVSAATSGDECQLCAEGRYGVTVGAGSEDAACSDCPEGWHADLRAQTACAQCMPGEVSSTPAAANCTACGPGEYQDQPAKDTCRACPAGYFSKDDAQSFCGLCPAGHMQAALGSSSCPACAAGSHRAPSDLPAVRCAQCAPGLYTNSTGNADCVTCPAGFALADSGGTGCGRCSGGYVAGEPGASHCAACATGRFAAGGDEEAGGGAALLMCLACLPGRYAANSESTACAQCPVGFFAQGPGASGCAQCPAGFAQAVPAASSCTQCPAGRFAAVGGASACTACPVGTKRGNRDLPAVKCAHCAPGLFSDRAEAPFCKDCNVGRFAAHRGSATCSGCEEGNVTDRSGRSACEPCPHGLIPDSKHILCTTPNWTTAGECVPYSEYLADADADRSLWRCEPCPPGAVCADTEGVVRGRQRTLAQLEVDHGFWNATWPELDWRRPALAIVPCPYPDDCLPRGCASTSLNDSAVCAVCAEAHYREVKRCVPCTGETSIMKALPLLTAAVLLLLLGCTHSKAILRFRRRHGAAWRDVLRIVTITLSFAQINASFPALMVDFPWPADYLAFLKQWSFIDFDLVELLGAKCMGGNFWDFRARVVVATLCPVATVLVFAIAYCTRRTKVRRSHRRERGAFPPTRVEHACEHLFDIVDHDGSGLIEPHEFKSLLQRVSPNRAAVQILDDAEVHAHMVSMGGMVTDIVLGAVDVRVPVLSRSAFVSAAVAGKMGASIRTEWVAYSELQQLKNVYVSTLLMCLFVLHAPVSARLCRYFACTDVAGRKFLREDFSIACGEGTYSDFAPYVVGFMMLFTFAFPLALLLLLLRHHRELYTPRVYERFGFLYASFQEGCEYWELHELARKLILTGLLVFFPTVSRAAVSIVVCVGNVATLNYFRPHRNKVVFGVEQFSYLLTTFKCGCLRVPVLCGRRSSSVVYLLRHHVC